MATKTKQPKQVTNIQPVLHELHKAYDKANQVLFGGELPEVVITIQTRGNRAGVLGWFTVNPLWTSDNNELHEINLTAEALNRDYMDILQTLIHEMVHCYCSVKGIKDTSRGNTYHNKRFKEQAELHGMEYTHEKPDAKIGYSAVTLTDKTKNLIKFWNINKEAFKIARKDFTTGKTKKKSNIRKYVCPCGTIIRASKEVNVICGDCEGKFEEEV